MFPRCACLRTFPVFIDKSQISTDIFCLVLPLLIHLDYAKDDFAMYATGMLQAVRRNRALQMLRPLAARHLQGHHCFVACTLERVSCNCTTG